ncbi:unnamed protein product [Closterium sp. NIES-53]
MTDDSPIQRLSDHLLARILHLASAPGRFQHALVCKKWRDAACRVQDAVQLRADRRMDARRLLSELSSFPRLTELILCDRSLTSIPEGFLSALSATHPELIKFHFRTMFDTVARIECFTEEGLSRFFQGCTRLEDLNLESPPALPAIPAAIGALARLAHLHLAAHVHRLPDAFTCLRALRTCVLHMPGLQDLPLGFGSLTCLQSLHLDACQSLASLPESFGELANLDRLSISGCSRFRLPGSFPALSSLRELKVKRCQALSPLPGDFGQLHALESLVLEEVGGITGLPESVGHLQRLQSLSINEWHDLSSLPTSLPHLSSLTHLHLNAPNLSLLPDGVGRSSRLRAFSLLAGRFTHLPKSIALATALQQLALHNLHSLTALPRDLGNLSSLRGLEIVECSELVGLPASLCLLSCLTRLTVSECPALAALPHAMGVGLHSLRELTLSCKSLTHLPPSFFKLTALEQLSIVHLPCVKGPLPDAFSRFTRLRDLSLVAMPHLTALPASLAALAPTLTSLRVDGCSHLRDVAEELSQLAMLQTLSLTRLRSLKSLPRSLLELPRLREVVVDECSESEEAISSVSWLATSAVTAAAVVAAKIRSGVQCLHCFYHQTPD